MELENCNHEGCYHKSLTSVKTSAHELSMLKFFVSFNTVPLILFRLVILPHQDVPRIDQKVKYTPLGITYSHM